MKYGMRNAPPPFEAACPGNLRKFPRPIALPATAIITPNLEAQVSLALSTAI
jgi:hypothetical protein